MEAESSAFLKARRPIHRAVRSGDDKRPLVEPGRCDPVIELPARHRLVAAFIEKGDPAVPISPSCGRNAVDTCEGWPLQCRPDRHMRARAAPARLSMMWAVIQHVSYEGQGNIAPALRRARLRSVDLSPFQGELPPRAADLSGLIVLGAPSGSADDETTKHLAAERQLISDAPRAAGSRCPLRRAAARGRVGRPRSQRRGARSRHGRSNAHCRRTRGSRDRFRHRGARGPTLASPQPHVAARRGATGHQPPMGCSASWGPTARYASHALSGREHSALALPSGAGKSM